MRGKQKKGGHPRIVRLVVFGAVVVALAMVGLVTWRWQRDRSYIGTTTAITLDWSCWNDIFWHTDYPKRTDPSASSAIAPDAHQCDGEQSEGPGEGSDQQHAVDMPTRRPELTRPSSPVRSADAPS
jgi:hypothetical protein